MANKQIDLALPSVKSIVKTAVAVAIVMFAIRMTPDTWGIKKWFMAA